jgi:hypothetical protein
MLLKQLGVAERLQLLQPSDVVYRVRSGGELDRLTTAE